MENVNKIKPTGLFTNYIFKTIPLAFDESMSYYETLSGLLAYLRDTVIPAVDNNADAIVEVQNKIIELQNYVDHYFDNLDVQEEINNKLDEMAEDGQLTDIIAQYLQLAGVLAYDTKTAMKSATNLVNGSITKTLGNTTYQDGQGAFYKIRQIQNTDVIDDENIIALYDPALVAEKIPYSSGYELQEQINAISNSNDITICLSDSYGNQENEWCELLISKLGLTLNTTGFNFSGNGAGFSNSAYSQFITNLQTGISNFTTQQKQNVKQIIVCGGYNDRDASQTDIETAINSFISYCKTTFPNAKVYVGFIANDGTSNQSNGGSTQIRDHFMLNVFPAYKNCTKYGGIYLNGVEYVMHNYNYFMEDDVHPNENGEVALTNAIFESLKAGYVSLTYTRISPTMQDKDGQAGIGGVVTTFLQFINNKINYFIGGRYQPAIVEGTSYYTTTSGTEQTVPFPYFSDNQYLRRSNIFCFITLNITIEYTDNTFENNIGLLSPSSANKKAFNLTFTPHKTGSILRIYVNGVGEVDALRF